MLIQLFLNFILLSGSPSDTADLDIKFTDLLFRGEPGQRTWLWRHFFKSEYSRQGTVIRTDSSLLIFVDQYGVVFEIKRKNNRYHIQRIDQTVSSGFTTQAYVFKSNDNFYSFGGYGFWQTNGQLRIFLPQRGDWEIVQLNTNLPSFNKLTWHDASTSTLWMAQQDYLSEGYGDAARREEFKVYSCSLKDFKWIEKGVLTEYPGRIMGWPFHFLLETPFGVLVANSNVNYEIWALSKNERFSLGSISDSIRLNFSHLNNYGYNDFSMVWVQDTIIVYDHLNRIRVGNIALGKKKLIPLNSRIYHRKLRVEDWYPLVLLCTLVTGISIYFFTKKKALTESGSAQYSNDPEVAEDFFWSSLSAEERTVLTFFRDLKNTTFSLDVNQLNNLIGLEGKSFDAQKNKRSEVIAGINKKFSGAFRNAESLIKRVRSTQDKRSYFYVLNEKFISLIKRPS